MSLRLRRGTNAERLTFTPTIGEPIYTIDTKRLFIGDGLTVGGIPVYDSSYELDPIFTASPAFTITLGDITDWNTAFSWGDHSTVGYLTSFSETDPIWLADKPSYLTIALAATTYSPLGHTHTFSSITSKPTTLSGYGIIDGVPSSRTITINGVTQSLSLNRTWTIDALPTQTGNSGKFLTTNGTIASWATVDLSAYTPTSRTLTINGTTYDLTANRSWTINSMVYPSAGIAVSTGSSWGTSIIDNSTNWNTAYSWGDHSLAGYLTSFTELDPIFSASDAATITSIDISNWNAKQTAYTNLTSIGSLSNNIGWLYNNGSGIFSYSTPTAANVNAWGLTGNSGTDANSFIGTTDNSSLRFRTDGVERMVINSATGNVGIGIAPSTSKLNVYGNIVSTSPTGNGSATLSVDGVTVSKSGSGSITFTGNNGNGVIFANYGGFARLQGITIALNIVNTVVGSLTSGGFGLNTSGVFSIAASSILDVQSTTKGFLQPRMTAAQMAGISAPATGLQVFNVTDSSNYLYTGTISGWNRIVHSGTTQSVGIGGTPDSSAQLDVSSTTKGFLPPRMTTAERDAISSPASGLVVYNTTDGNMQEYNNGSQQWLLENSHYWPFIPSGYWFCPVASSLNTLSTSGAFSSNTSNSNNNFSLITFKIVQKVEIDEIAFFQNVANDGANARLDVYIFKDNNGLPGEVIHSDSTGNGSLNTGSSLKKCLVDFTLNPGYYWLAVGPRELNTAGANPTFFLSQSINASYNPFPDTQMSYTNNQVRIPQIAAAPNPIPDNPSVSYGGSTVRNYFTFYFRKK